MKGFLLVFALVGTSLTQNPPPSQCYTSDLAAATAVLAQRIGLQNTTGIWKDYTILNYFLLDQWGQNPGSTQNILNCCNALDVFYGMLYPKGNYYCFSLKNLLYTGADPTSAFSISGTFEQYSFNCGAGLTTLLHENLPCVQRVVAGYQNTLKNCLTSFTLNVLHDPINQCQYLTQWENCFSAPFNTSICRSTASADTWWACESARRFGINRAINCVNSCDYVTGPPRAAEYLAEHHKIDETGTHLFKIPDYWDMVDGVKTLVKGAWMKD
ncbi:unnamed protein product, partial [Mesorhabditis belari]|uniref:Secreted protein n=1 Tax=Mesorhabditis belari TaxID=2138241 RepID=A0AAF3FR75_9BILA